MLLGAAPLVEIWERDPGWPTGEISALPLRCPVAYGQPDVSSCRNRVTASGICLRAAAINKIRA
jgi:hypothetical protein